MIELLLLMLIFTVIGTVTHLAAMLMALIIFYYVSNKGVAKMATRSRSQRLNELVKQRGGPEA